MGFFGSFFGDDQRADLTQAKQQADAALSQGYNDSQGYYGKAYDLYSPYAQSGQQASTMYNNALGINGQAAQQQFMNNYASSDPFRQANADYTTNTLLRNYRANGLLDSGASQLATARANLQQGSQDYNNYLNRLQGVGQTGYNATSSQAGIYGQQGQTAMGYGQQRAAGDISYGNAMAASENTGINNLLSLAGVAAKAYAGAPSGGYSF